MDLDAHRVGMQTFTKVEVFDRQIHDYNTFIVVTLKAELAGTFCYTRIWQQRQDCWQVVAGHASQIIHP
jgi:hypothetical protein